MGKDKILRLAEFIFLIYQFKIPIMQSVDLLSVDLLSVFYDNCYEVNTMNLMHIFAMNVKYYRQSKGISQEKLAELSGLHRTYISAIERERRNIAIENIENIASALEVEPYQLLMPITKE